jgi:hypothetical protein
MKLVISEKQLNELVTQLNLNKEITEEGDGEGAPEAGTSSDGEQKTGASKWESGVTRGPANQIGVTKWADSYKITRGRANPLSEQSDYMMDKRGNALLNATGIRSDKDYKAVDQAIDKSRKEMFGGPIDPHTLNMVLAIGALFIPYVGPFISAGIGAYDAKLYYDEGDKKTAGLVLMFSLLPGVGSIVNKIPGVKQLGAKGMSEIAKKLSMGAKITNPNEIAIVNQISKNRGLIQAEMEKMGKDATIAAARKGVQRNIVKKNVANKAVGAGAGLIGYGGLGVAYSMGYDKLTGKPKQDINTFKQSKPEVFTSKDMVLVNGEWEFKD